MEAPQLLLPDAIKWGIVTVPGKSFAAKLLVGHTGKRGGNEVALVMYVNSIALICTSWSAGALWPGRVSLGRPPPGPSVYAHGSRIRRTRTAAGLDVIRFPAPRPRLGDRASMDALAGRTASVDAKLPATSSPELRETRRRALRFQVLEIR
jgi:hypothetical protein